MFETKTIYETEKQLNTDTKQGLTGGEVLARQKTYGKNELAKEKKKGIVSMILEQLNEPLIFVLFVAAAVSLLLGELGDMAIIFAVITVNTSALSLIHI